MKLFKIDNANQDGINCDSFQIVTKGKKAILIPPDFKIVSTGGFIPFIQNKNNDLLLKYCPKCKQWQYLNFFNQTKHKIDGYKEICRNCDNTIRRKRYAKLKSVT